MKQIAEIEDKLSKLPEGAGADRERIDLMNELAHRYANIDSKKAMHLALESQRLARARDYAKGLAGGMWLEGMCCFWHGDYTLAVARSQEALKIYAGLHDVIGQANAHNVLGSCLLKTGDHAQALIHHLKSLKLWQEANDPHGLSSIYNNLGADYWDIGDYARSLEYYLKSLELKQEAGDPMSEAAALMNIGSIYERMENHSEALEYYHRSQKLLEQAGDARQGLVLNNIGGVYEKLKEYQNALSCYRKSLALAQQQGYRQAEATILTNIGVVCHCLGQNREAEEHFRKSLTVSGEIDEKVNIAGNLILLGELLAETGTFYDCIKPLERGLAIAEQIKAGDLLIQAYEAMYEVHKRWEKYREALDYHEKFVAEEKKVFSEASRQKMYHLNVQCEVSKYQKEAELLRHRNEELERANRELAELNAQIRAAGAEKDSLLRKLEDQNIRLEAMVTEDAQSGLYNKRALRDKLKHEMSRTRRYHKPLTVAVTEIDSYSEIAGRLTALQLEQMIKSLARIFRENLRLVDIVGRYNNRTFACAFPETGRSKALSICERLQKLIVRHDWRQIHHGLALSISVGLAEAARIDDPDKLILEAKVKLTQAADKGPGRIA